MQKKILTVIVTSYNYEKYIKENLDALTNQTCKDFDIIVIDDGSSDNSVNIIKKYLKRHKNIKFLQHENGVNKGLCKTTLVALEHVDTEYVAFCESDDYWDIDHVKNLLSFIKKHPEANMIFNKLEVKNYSSNPEYDSYTNSTNISLAKLSGTNIFKLMTSNYMPTFSSACIKTSELKKCDFNSFYPQYLDFWLWRQLCLKNKIFFVDNSISYWRKHNESYDMKDNIKDTKSFLIASNNIILKNLNVSFITNLKLNLFRFILCKKLFIKRQIKFIIKYYS